jgi:hypothetical protein
MKMRDNFDAASLSYADIRPHYGTFRSILISGSGRNKVFKNRTGIMTNIGDIEESEWLDLAIAVVDSKGDNAEFQKTLEWVKRQSKYNRLKTEKQFLQSALERFIHEKTSPKKQSPRRRFKSKEDFDVPFGFKELAWVNATAEVMEDGSEWVAVITELGEIQEDLWLELSAQLINDSGHGQVLLDETERSQKIYGKLLANDRVDERFMNLMAVQSTVRNLANK